MKEEDKKQFILSMKDLGTAHQREMTQDVLRVYFQSLSDLSIYQVCKAIEHFILEGETFPRVSKLREMAKSIREYRTPPPERILVPERPESEGPPMTNEEVHAKLDELLEKLSKGTEVSNV